MKKLIEYLFNLIMVFGGMVGVEFLLCVDIDFVECLVSGVVCLVLDVWYCYGLEGDVLLGFGLMLVKVVVLVFLVEFLVYVWDYVVVVVSELKVVDLLVEYVLELV